MLCPVGRGRGGGPGGREGGSVWRVENLHGGRERWSECGGCGRESSTVRRKLENSIESWGAKVMKAPAVETCRRFPLFLETI